MMSKKNVGWPFYAAVVKHTQGHIYALTFIDSLVPRSCMSYFKGVIFKLIIQNICLGACSHYSILDKLIHEKSQVVQVMA